MFVAALLAGGCSTAPTAPTPEPTATPTPTATPQPTPTPTPASSPTPTPQPPDILFRYTAAVHMLRAGRYEDAIPQFDMVIRVLPDYAQAYNDRGIAYFHEEQEELALEDFSKAIELKPDFTEAYVNRAALYIKREDVANATTDLRMALSLFEEQGDQENADEVRKLLGFNGP